MTPWSQHVAAREVSAGSGLESLQRRSRSDRLRCKFAPRERERRERIRQAVEAVNAEPTAGAPNAQILSK